MSISLSKQHPSIESDLPYDEAQFARLKKAFAVAIDFFPELDSDDFSVEWDEAARDLVDLKEHPEDPCKLIFTVSPVLYGAPNQVLIGGIARELAPFVIEDKLTRWQSFLDLLFFKISPHYRKLDQRNAELLVLSRALGNELLKFKRHWKEEIHTDEFGFAYDDQEGISIEELENILCPF